MRLSSGPLILGLVGGLCSAPPRQATDTRWDEWTFDADGLNTYMVIPQAANIRETLAGFCSHHNLSTELCTSFYGATLQNHPRLKEQTHAPYEARQLLSFDPCIRLSFTGPGEPAFNLVIDAFDNTTEVSSDFCSRLGVRNCEAVENAVAEHIRQAGDHTHKECPSARLRRQHRGLDPPQHELTSDPHIPPTRVHCRHPLATTVTCVYHDLYVVDGRFVVGVSERAESSVHDIQLCAKRTRGLCMHAFHPELVGVEGGLRGMLRGRPVAEVETPVVLLERHQPASHGHILHDAVLPLFWALNEHPETRSHVSTRSVRVVVLDDKGAHPHDTWFRLVTDRPPIYDHEIPYKLCPHGSVCRLRTAVAGLGGMGLVDVNTAVGDEELELRSNLLAAFEQHAVNVLGLQAPHDGPPRVTIVQRLHHRDIKNTAELVEGLKAAVPSAVVDVVAPDHGSMLDQVALVRSSAVLIAVEGGALDTLMVARGGLHVVAIGRDPGQRHPVGCADETGHCADPFAHLPFFEMLRRRGIETSLVPTPAGSDYRVDVERVAEAVVAALETTRVEIGV